MNEIIDALKVAINSYEYDGEKEKAEVIKEHATKLEHSMSDSILKQIKRAAYEDGVMSALSELREVYGAGIEDTDIWAEYMKEEDN